MEDYINELSISDDNVLIIERLLDDYGTEIKRLAYLSQTEEDFQIVIVLNREEVIAPFHPLVN